MRAWRASYLRDSLADKLEADKRESLNACNVEAQVLRSRVTKQRRRRPQNKLERVFASAAAASATAATENQLLLLRRRQSLHEKE